VTERLYLDDASLRGTAIVTATGNGDALWVTLDRTWFHPQGGGQKSDVGTIEAASVAKVVFDEVGDIRHLVDSVAGLEVGAEVEVAVDGTVRDLHARLHSGGHLLAAIVEKADPDLRAVGAHHWPGEARVDFEGGDETTALAVESWLQLALDRGVADDLDVHRGVDADGRRTIAVGNHSPVGCGGTHVASTLGIGSVKLVSVKRKKGRLRIRYDVATD
jgi:Ser-tRNA(Ala) deacylase AlaX